MSQEITRVNADRIEAIRKTFFPVTIQRITETSWVHRDENQPDASLQYFLLNLVGIEPESWQITEVQAVRLGFSNMNPVTGVAIFAEYNTVTKQTILQEVENDGTIAGGLHYLPKNPHLGRNQDMLQIYRKNSDLPVDYWPA